jgi:hypothetical protein
MAIKKYGWSSLNHEILASGLTHSSANHFESFYIKHFNTIYPNGYNLTSGGDNSILSEETKIKISASISGYKHPLFGKKHKSSTIEKMIAVKKGKTHTQNHCAKIRASKIGKKLTPEHKAKISESKVGDKHHMFGKNHTIESIAKMSDSKSGKNNPNFGKFGKKHHSSKTYRITRPDETIEIITGLREYCIINKLNQSNMSSVVNGKYKQHLGYKCEHYNEEKEDIEEYA